MHLLYRQNYLAADQVDHRRDFIAFIIQTELPRFYISVNVIFAY